MACVLRTVCRVSGAEHGEGLCHGLVAAKHLPVLALRHVRHGCTHRQGIAQGKANAPAKKAGKGRHQQMRDLWHIMQQGIKTIYPTEKLSR